MMSNTRDTSFGQQVSELFSGASVFDLDFGVQSASAKQPIERDSVGSGHECHHWTLSFDDHLDH